MKTGIQLFQRLTGFPLARERRKAKVLILLSANERDPAIQRSRPLFASSARFYADRIRHPFDDISQAGFFADEKSGKAHAVGLGGVFLPRGIAYRFHLKLSPEVSVF